MLNFLPVPATDATPRPYAEAVSRLASVRHALRLVDEFGGGPASDVDDSDRLAEGWAEAGPARRACFDRKSEMTVAATAAGVESLMAERKAGREPHREASKALVDEIRRELAEVSRLVLR